MAGPTFHAWRCFKRSIHTRVQSTEATGQRASLTMALSALWKRLGRWSSAMSQLLQPFKSTKASCTKAPANTSQQPGQDQQPFRAPRAPPAGTRTLLPPPAPRATTRGNAAPSHTAMGVLRARRKPLAPAPPVRRHRQKRPASSAKPSGTPLASSSSAPDRTTPMDWEATPSINTSLATDVEMEEDNTHHCDISLATDVEMEEENAHHCNISVTTDVPMDEDTLPRAGTSLPTRSTASHSQARRGRAIRGSVVTAARITMLHKKGLLKEALKGFSSSKGAVGTSQKDRSSVPMPTAQAGTSGTSPQHNTSSLAMGLQRHRRKRKTDSGPGTVSKAKRPTLGAGAQRGH